MDIMAKQRRMIIAVIFAFFFCFFLLRTGSAHAVSPPEDIDYGLSMDEQQGGSGLVGDVVRILNGNNIENRQDISFPSPNRMGLSFDATYNSLSGTTGYLGFGWTHTYEVSVDPSFEIESETYVRILDSTGRALYFVEQGGGVYGGAFKERSYVKEESGEYIWYRLDGNRYGFSGPGRLNWIEDGKSGTSLVMSYDAQDRLDTVTDTSSGRDLTFQYNANGRLESVSGPITNAVPSGIWVTYAYDADQNLVSVTYADGSGFDYTYTDPNDIHNLTEKRDKLNHLLKSFTYDTQDRVTDNFCVEGRGASINYVSATGIEVTDAYGTLRTYTLSDMDGRKRITAMTGVGGAPYSQNNAVRWQYDTQMRLTEVEYKGGTINQYRDYDERGNPGTVKLAAGTPDERVISYTYHEDMNVPLTRTEAGVLAGGNKVTIWDYDNDYDETPNEDPAILLSRIIEQGFTKDASGTNIGYEYITAFTYNTKGQVLSIDGPKQGTGDITSFAYNSTTGNLLSITRPLIGPTSFSDYDNAGYPGRIEDVNGREKTFSYDGRGRITGITNVSDGSTTSIVYNPAGKQESVTDPDGITKTYAYDGTYGRLTRVTDPEGNYMAYDYDTQGNRIEKSKHYSSGERTSLNRWTYEHPVMPGKLYKEINADDTFTEYGYDSEGNVASVTDARDHTTTYEYDPFNRLYKVTQPGTMITSYAYDSHGNLIEVIDAQGHETTYVYDDMGRLVSTTSPDTGTMTYVYDEAGNLVEKTDAKGILVSYTYDLLNRLTAVHFPDSSQDITYTWDTGANGMGQLGAMTDTSGSMTFDYDNRGRLAQKTSTIGSRSFDLAYAYTPADRLSTFTYPTGRTVDYTRNSRGHIEGATTTLNDVSTTLAENIVYGPFGPGRGMATGSGGQVNNTYDESGRMTVANPGKEKERSFTYDANGNLTSIQARNNPHYNQEFTYDALNRLISATGRYGTISYTYDNVGNRLTRTIDDQTETYSYIAGTNRLQGIAGPNPITFTYDANGNTTGMGDKTLAYNQNNRLINAEENSTVLGEYTYNGRGQRVKKSFNGETILFIYDQAGQLISEADDKGDILREYVYLGLNRLCQFVYKIPKHIEVRVTTSKGRNLGGINVYAFTESGSYTGLHAVTDDQGVASFETEQFSEGNYKFRADYVSYQFWSSVITVPGTYSAEVVIEEETAEITVTVAGEAKEGVKVYVFNEDGTYLGIYGETDSQGKVSFDLPVGYSFKFRADHMASQYWSDTTVIGSGGSTYVPVDTGGGVLTVTVQKDPENPIAGINVYLFSASGTYLAHFDTTDGNGQVSFTVSEGNYKVRADYQQNQYWATEPIDAHQVNVVNINTGGGEFILTVEKQAGSPLVDVPVYVFTSGGTYLGITAQTDDQGEVAFDLSDGDYKFRADYLSGQFWTDVVTVPTTLSDTLVIPHQDVTITVNGVYGAESDPLEGVSVYLFTASGSYMGQNQVTNSLGQVTFNLPQEYYKVRLDYLSGQFWSDVFVWQDADVDIDHGIVDVHVTFNGEDVADAPVYLFTTSGSYLGRYEYTDAYGHAAFLIPAQSYKFRVDYDCTQYWSDVVNVIAHEETDVEMPLEQLAFNKTNDPNPSRYDGKPPVFEPERIKVASIGSLAGILSQSIIANTTPPKVYYYLNDHLGTPQLMTDENNVVVWEAKYRPFGEAVVHPYSTVENNIRFPGQYFDQETGLHYNYHRYYDPRTGRYLRADPSHFVQPRGNNIPYLISFILNSPQEQNYYTFVKNDPINNIDMYGLISIPDYRCIEKCQVICGLQAADCFRRAIYYPDIFIGAACLVLTRGNVYICASVVGGYSVISFYICAKQEQKCLDDCISNCEDICFQ